MEFRDFFGVKKIIIACLIVLPILALALFTVVSMRVPSKSRTINENTFTYRPPSEITDEIASYIEADDFETAFVRIDGVLKDPNIPTSRGVPLLVLAAQKDNRDLCAVLIAKGADTNIPDSNNGETALIKAARNGNIELMNMLLIANADVNAQSRRGVSVLTAAIQNGDPLLIEFLLSRGARAGSTRENMFNYAFQKKFVGVDAMLKTGVPPNSIDANGNTPLIIAAAYGDMPSARALITYKANVNAANNIGMTPLLYAIQTKNKDMTQYFLEKGADVNKANNNGETPLFWAAYYGDTQLVDVLLKLDADYKKTTKSNMTALSIAERNKKSETAKLLKDFIAYKNLPRDEKGRPIVPKTGAAAAKTAAKKTAAGKKAVKPDSAAAAGMSAVPGMPAGMPAGFDPAAMGIPTGALPAEMGGAGAAAPAQKEPPRTVGGTQINTLRTSSLAGGGSQ
ncbi:MAG: ankyrin repeat domain-containing protein [Elusimicrobiota bacterium]|jgi:ankyrin repeat protein|nr:ankyrin repeat domain-containing protein [Elusimicrobiota bacterium]